MNVCKALLVNLIRNLKKSSKVKTDGHFCNINVDQYDYSIRS